MMFTATWLQTATYLFAICPFSIAFLVFMNSSVSFVITDLVNLPTGEGDAAGTLGFADELLALVACPIWGIISDRIGVRYVCCAGYAVIALSLVLFVQARNVYPELLLGRLLFCVGGSAVATMVTAVLPSVTGAREIAPDSTGSPCCVNYNGNGNGDSPLVHSRQTSTVTSIASERTITPASVRTQSPDTLTAEKTQSQGSPSRLAGFVGTLTGCGALLALFVFLPLPASFEKAGLSPADAIKRSYYVVACVALVISVVCFFGLRNLKDDEGKGLRSVLRPFRPPERLDVHEESPSAAEDVNDATPSHSKFQSRYSLGLAPKSYLGQIGAAFLAGFKDANIGLGYVGGFVARASSVGISLFIPLYVNQYYRNSGLCHEGGFDGGNAVLSDSDIGGIKKSCPRAYIVASILTGASQLVALIFAPAFGYLSGRSRHFNFPLLTAAIVGIVGYILLALLSSPQLGDGNNSAVLFIDMALIGISQIGAIVCSLGVLGTGILAVGDSPTPQDQHRASLENSDNTASDDEHSSLLRKRETARPRNLAHLKGSIAGMYSLFGGAGILILTKLGGLLFDKVSPRSPFYVLAIFNGLLLVTSLVHGVRQYWKIQLDGRNGE